MLEQYQKRLSALHAEYKHAAKQVREERNALAEARELVACTEEAQRIIQEVAQRVQQKAHDQIASVVSLCLEAVFDNPYRFVIRFVQKRGRTEAVLVFVDKDEHELDPMAGVGGGVKDVAAFALRLSNISLSQPQKRKLVIMDEPFQFLKPYAKYGPRIRPLLEQLKTDLGVQMILVNNIQQYQTGTIIQIGEE